MVVSAPSFPCSSDLLPPLFLPFNPSGSNPPPSFNPLNHPPTLPLSVNHDLPYCWPGISPGAAATGPLRRQSPAPGFTAQRRPDATATAVSTVSASRRTGTRLAARLAGRCGRCMRRWTARVGVAMFRAAAPKEEGFVWRRCLPPTDWVRTEYSLLECSYS